MLYKTEVFKILVGYIICNKLWFINDHAFFTNRPVIKLTTMPACLITLFTFVIIILPCNILSHNGNNYHVMVNITQLKLKQIPYIISSFPEVKKLNPAQLLKK